MSYSKLLLGSVVLAGWLAWDLGAQESGHVERSQAVTIELKPRVTAATGIVRISDVADLRGANGPVRSRMAALDLAELDGVRREVVVTQEQVYFRLRLAGWEPRTFQLTGAGLTMIGRSVNNETLGVVPAAATTPAIPRPAATSQIKVRDPVRLLARIGNVQVSALGEALQEGQVGQLIRVRNVTTNRIVSGRIAEQNIVEVDY